MLDHPRTAPYAFGALLQELAAEPDVLHTLDSVVVLAVDTIPGCDWAGVTVRHGKEFTTPAATAPVVNELDQAQYDLSQGPCVDAVRLDGTFLIEDMASETRWPDWAPVAHRLGVGSSLSVRLAAPKGTVGGLNLYAKNPRGFDDDDVNVAHHYATHAGAALAIANEVTNLQTALQTRHSIGAAQGILRHRHGLTLDQGFKVLVRVSRNNNVRLRELADMVIEANGLPAQFMGD